MPALSQPLALLAPQLLLKPLLTTPRALGCWLCYHTQQAAATANLPGKPEDSVTTAEGPIAPRRQQPQRPHRVSGRADPFAAGESVDRRPPRLGLAARVRMVSPILYIQPVGSPAVSEPRMEP
ncbi:unnamed protein product [Diplocarpon coronariae]